MKIKIMPFLTGVFLILCSSLSLAGAGQGFTGVGEAVGKGLDELVSGAMDSSGKVPVYKFIEDSGLDIDKIDDKIIIHLRDTDAFENPMNFFTRDKGDPPDVSFKDVFFKPPYTTHTGSIFIDSYSLSFLNKFFDTHLDPHNSEHTLAFLKLLEDSIEDNGNILKAIVETDSQRTLNSLHPLRPESSGRIMEAVLIQHEEMIINSSVLNPLFGNWVKYSDPISLFYRLFSDDNTPSINNTEGLLASLIRKAIAKFDPGAPVADPPPVLVGQKLWVTVRTLSSDGHNEFFESFRAKIAEIVRAKLSKAKSQEAIKEVFENDDELKALFQIAREDERFFDLLQETVSEAI